MMYSGPRPYTVGIAVSWAFLFLIFVRLTIVQRLSQVLEEVTPRRVSRRTRYNMYIKHRAEDNNRRHDLNRSRRHIEIELYLSPNYLYNIL